MNAFYGSASYLWLVLAVTCTMGQHGDWGMLWISLFVGAYVLIGRAVIFMVTLMWEMQHDPAKFHNMMDYYISFIMEQQDIRKYLKYGK